LNRHKQIREYLDSFLRDFQDSLARLSILGQLKKVIERAQKDVGIVVDQSALMQDLLIYFQNTCISSFTGNKIPERKPEDLSLPRLVQDKKGILRISVCPNKNSN